MGTLISLCAKVSGRQASVLALRGPFLWVISTKERATISRASVERCWIYVCLFKAVVRAVKSRWHGQHACAKVYARLFCKISWVIKLALTVPDDFLYGWNLFLMMSGDSQCNKINGELQITKLAKMNSDAHNFSLELGSKSAENTGHAVATRSAYVSRDKAELWWIHHLVFYPEQWCFIILNSFYYKYKFYCSVVCIIEKFWRVWYHRYGNAGCSN